MANLETPKEAAHAEKIKNLITAKGGKVLWNDVVNELDFRETRTLQQVMEYAKQNGVFYRSLESRTDANGKLVMDLYLTTTKPITVK